MSSYRCFCCGAEDMSVISIRQAARMWDRTGDPQILADLAVLCRGIPKGVRAPDHPYYQTMSKYVQINLNKQIAKMEKEIIREKNK